MKPITKSLTRHILTGGGVAGVTLTNDFWLQVLSGMVTLASIIWSIMEQCRTKTVQKPGDITIKFLLLAPLLTALVGCVAPPPTSQSMVQVRVNAILADYPTSVDWFRHIGAVLAEVEKGNNLQPDHVLSAIRPADRFTSGQYASRSALHATQQWRQIFDTHYRNAYRPSDPDGNRALLRALREGVMAAVSR